MCLNPKIIYKKGRYVNDTYRGKKGEGYELTTYSKCGSCEICIAEKANNWVVRNYYETRAHKQIAFITLTYAENPYILVKKDMQDFLKRFRIKLDREGLGKVRFFGCGEYGTLNSRPHKHLIVYGWTEEHAKYLGINKKINPIFQSKLIEDTWGLGRTTIQQFDTHEIPYISLYNTPQEEFSRAYKLSLNGVGNIRNQLMGNLRMKKAQRLNLLQELENAEKELTEEKSKYKLIKEYNTWSIALGWSEFFKEFEKNPKNYVFTEYIEDKEFATPSPWVKKLANMGYPSAIAEMYRREELARTEEELDEEKERLRNLERVNARRKNELLNWTEQKTRLETF